MWIVLQNQKVTAISYPGNMQKTFLLKVSNLAVNPAVQKMLLLKVSNIAVI